MLQNEVMRLVRRVGEMVAETGMIIIIATVLATERY